MRLGLTLAAFLFPLMFRRDMVSRVGMTLKDIRPGPIRHAQLSPALVLRIETVQTALAEVCPLTEPEWQDAFRRDPHPEHEVLWWERLAGCYVALIAARSLSPIQREAAFKVIVGLFSGLGAEQLQPDLEELPESVRGELIAIVKSLRK
jgi:hypothetical protein